MQCSVTDIAIGPKDTPILLQRSLDSYLFILLSLWLLKGLVDPILDVERIARKGNNVLERIIISCEVTHFRLQIIDIETY